MKTEEDIVSFYSEQKLLYRQLLTLTRSIRYLAQKGATEQIPVKLDARKELFGRIRAIDEKFGLTRKKLAFFSEEEASGGNARASDFVKGIRKIIEEINEMDTETRLLVQREKEAVSDELKKVSAGHKLVKKYVPFYSNTPAYFSMSA
ncbi:MAG: flagellar protein FliT [Deltaproteobacteria bacterium]|nr:flagellar protein FliT [Deltaproteobacteria bacterium]